MKRKLLLLFIFSCFMLSGCNESTGKANNYDLTSTTNSASEDLSETKITYLMELITGKYVIIDNYERDSELYNENLANVIINCEKANKEIPKNNSLLSIDLEELSLMVTNSTEKLVNKNYEDSYSDSHEIGRKISEMSEKYLNGKLPPSANALNDIYNK